MLLLCRIGGGHLVFLQGGLLIGVEVLVPEVSSAALARTGLAAGVAPLKVVPGGPREGDPVYGVTGI